MKLYEVTTRTYNKEGGYIRIDVHPTVAASLQTAHSIGIWNEFVRQANLPEN